MATFSERLKNETAEKHDAAESSGFISTLMAGERSARDYTRLLGQYIPLYEALEEAVAKVRETKPSFEGLLDPKLDRLASLKADYAVLAQQNGLPAVPTVTDATAKYVSVLQDLGNLNDPLDPYRVLAHHYLRYLGDLSGGQIISTLVGRHYEVPAEARTAWHFEGIDKMKVYKDAYREQLTAAVETPAAQDALIEEAKYGFDLNRELFNALGHEPELSTAL